MKEWIATHVKKSVEGINAYIALQYLWIIEIYYLGLNALMREKWIVKEIIKDLGVGEKSVVPEIILEWNAMILSYMSTYRGAAFLLAVSLIILGWAYFWFQFSFLGHYKKLYHIQFGGYAGYWLLLMVICYDVYNWSTILFLLMAPILAGIQWAKDAIKDRIMRR